MADRPILFKPEMVQAILREIEKPGEGKTQTRRVLKVQPFADGYIDGDISLVDLRGGLARFAAPAVGVDAFRETLCEVPFAVGDRLWVRETWRRWHDEDFGNCGHEDHCLCPTTPNSPVCFRADGYDIEEEMRKAYGIVWKPSIFMPRAYSRLTLQVTSVRVEQLQDIREADAIAEGCLMSPDGYPAELPDESGIGLVGWDCARDWFADLWDGIFGGGSGKSWDANPWVSVTTFKPFLKNIDLMGDEHE